MQTGSSWFLLKFHVAGFRFHTGMALSEMMRPGDMLSLAAEPENEHDPRAVRLEFGEMHVGYVPRDQNTIIAALQAQGAPLECKIVAIRLDAEPWEMIEAEIRLVRGEFSEPAQTVNPDHMGNRVYRKVIQMVSELHVRGYQRLRIAPGMSASGCHWRCAITPVTNISSRNGVKMISWDNLVAHYSSAQECEYFGWKDVANATPTGLADLFIERFSEIAVAGRGSDWLYAGWYLEMLNLTHPNALPIAYADWELPDDCLATVGPGATGHIPLPPPGLGDDKP